MNFGQRAAISAVAAVALLVPTAGSASAAPVDVALRGSGPSIVQSGASPVRVFGPASASSTMSVSLQLPMRNPSQMDQLIRRGVTLSPMEYRERFAPSQRQFDKVARWATGTGLEVTAVEPGAGAVRVSGTVGQVNQIFSVTMKRARLGEVNGLAVTEDPKVPASLGLTGIAGLNTLHQMQTDVEASPTEYGARPTSAPPDSVGIVLWGGDPRVTSQQTAEPRVTGGPGPAAYTSTMVRPSQLMTQCGPDEAKREHARAVRSAESNVATRTIRYSGSASCFDLDLTGSLARMVDDHRVSTIALPFAAPSASGLTAADRDGWDRPLKQAALTGVRVIAAGDLGLGAAGRDEQQAGGDRLSGLYFDRFADAR